MKIKRKLLMSIFLFALILTACRGKEDKKEAKPLVYTSFYPIYTMTKQIVGDTVEIRHLMPIDKDPHLWEPTPRDLKNLKNADFLIVNGANLEKFLPQVKKTLPDLKIITLSDNIELITYKGQAAIGDFSYMASQKAKRDKKYKIRFGHTHEDLMRIVFLKRNGESKDDLIKRGKKAMEKKGKLVEQHETIDVKENEVYSIEMGHESGYVFYKFPSDGDWVFIADRVSENILPYDLTSENGDKIDIEELMSGSTSKLDHITYDPHSWLNLTNAKSYFNTIYDTLGEKYPENKRKYYRNKVKQIDMLTNLEIEYKEKFKNIENRNFVVTHYAYEYLAREFGLTQYPLQGLVSTETPSLKTIRKAILFCRQKGLKTIFYEANNQAKGADTLASEVGANIDYLTSMEYMVNDERNYIDIMRENLEKLYNSFIEVKNENIRNQ